MCLLYRIMCLVQFLLISYGRFCVLFVQGSKFMVVFGKVIWVCFLVMWMLQVKVYFRLLFMVQLLMVVIEMFWKFDKVLKVFLKWCVILCVMVLLLLVKSLRLVLVEKNFLFLLVMIKVQILWLVLRFLIRCVRLVRVLWVQVLVGGLDRVSMVVWLYFFSFRLVQVFMCFFVRVQWMLFSVLWLSRLCEMMMCMILLVFFRIWCICMLWKQCFSGYLWMQLQLLCNCSVLLQMWKFRLVVRCLVMV